MELMTNMFNMQPSPEDKRDFTFPLVGGDEVVDDFLIGGELPNIYDQGRTSMCSGFAVALIEEYYTGKRHSPAFLYGNREEDDYVGEGEYLREAIKDWYRDGACLFEDFPLISNVEDCIIQFDELPESIKEYAKEYRIEAFYKLNAKDPQGVFELMQMFDLPVLASIPLYQSYAEAWKDNGIVPLPYTDEDLIGGHAVAFWGKETIDGQEHYILPNSWGDDVPVDGVQYIPIDYPVWDIYMPLPYVEKKILLIEDEENYFVNDELRTMDTKPVNKNSRVYVPLRFVVEAIGNVYVEWDGDNRTANVYRGGAVFAFREGDAFFTSSYSGTMHYYEDDTEREGLTANYIDENDRMMVPVRKVSEVFGYDVDYDNETKIITLSN